MNPIKVHLGKSEISHGLTLKMLVERTNIRMESMKMGMHNDDITNGVTKRKISQVAPEHVPLNFNKSPKMW